MLVLNDNDHKIQFGEIFDTQEAAQDAGNDAIHGGQAIGYAVLNRQKQKIEVYDSDFPTSGVFTQEVYDNSPFQTLTVHTDAPLKPSCGTGNFISRLPHSIGNGGVVGVEIDSITAEIASRLHNDRDNVKILNCGFEHSGLPDGSFDLAIGNVPFGDCTGKSEAD